MSNSSDHFGSLSWDFSGFALTKLLSASNGAEFVSQIFTAGAFKFQCKIYPNGRKKQQKGCVMLYFILQTSLTKKINKITVRARLYCPQTLCDWKHIQHLKKDNAGIGWHCNNMLLSEIQNHSHLKFICEITVVRIEYKNNPNTYHKATKMNIYTKHEWQIHNKLFQSFQTAHNGKFYHSTDFNNGCWCSSIAPNGSTAKDIGNVKCGLQLLQLPPFISRIKAHFSITAPMFNIKCRGKKEFNYNSTFIAWSDGTLLTQHLLSIDNSAKITFIIELVVAKIFDEYNKEIAKSDWLKYGLVRNVNSNDEMVQIDDEKSDLSEKCNFLSPSTTQMSILSPINIATHNSNMSNMSYMETKELREGNEEEEYEEEDLELQSVTTTKQHCHSRSYSTKISANFELINSHKNAISELSEKLDGIEIYKTEDEKNILLMEKSVMNLQKTQNRAQQQQFEQNAMLKQCINELSLTMHRLTNEIVFIKNKMNRIESRVDSQQVQIESVQHSKSSRRNSNCSNKSNKSSTRSDRKAAKKVKSTGAKRKSSRSISRDYAISSGLASWLKHECGFPAYVQLFAENGYDSFEIVKEMTRFELDDIGIHLKGHQFKIMREIEKLQSTQKHHRATGGTTGMNHLKMINYLTPVASPAGSDSARDVTEYNARKPLLSPTNEEHQSTYSHSKLFLHNLNSKTITNTNTNTNTVTESSHKASQSHTGKHIKQITPMHLTFGSKTLSPSLSTSLATSYTTTHSTTNGYFQWNQNKKPVLLESPTDFSRTNHNNHNYHNPKVYESRSIKKGYHNQILPMPQISDMWECKSCHNSNLGTIQKCQFCETQR